MSVKKIALVALTIIVATTMLLSGCGSASNSNILRVGVEVGYPPMEMVGDDGKTVVGFDIDMIKEIATRLGYKDIQIVTTDFTSIFDGLETNKYDVAVSSISIKPDRQKAHSQTKAYIANKQVIVTKTGDTSIKSPEDLVGKKIGLQQGTTAEDYIKEQIAKGKKLEYTPYQKVTQPFADLKIGRIDAVLVDILVADYYIGQDQASYQISWESPDAEPYAITFPKKSADLRDKTNKILDDMQSDGTMEKLSVKWFSKDITKNLG